MRPSDERTRTTNWTWGVEDKGVCMTQELVNSLHSFVVVIVVGLVGKMNT